VSGFFVGADIGGTNVKVGLVDRHGSLVGASHIDTRSDEGPERVIERSLSLAGDLLSETGASWRKVEGVGVACAGLVRVSTGVLVTAPNLPDWEDVPLAGILGAATDVDAYLDNDVNAFAYAESRLGVARGRSCGVFLALGTGVGGGLLIDGEVYRGRDGFAAELGHIVINPGGPLCECGNRGCLESMVRSKTIVEAAIELYRKAGVESELLRIAGGDLSRLTPEMLSDAASAGDASAGGVFRETGRWLGIAVGGLINVFNPEIVVIGGGVAQAGGPLLGPCRHWAGRYAFSASYASAPIVQASLGANAAMVGAALEARDKCGIPCG
jgi:glucokinase